MTGTEALEKIRNYILNGDHNDGTIAPILNWCNEALESPKTREYNMKKMNRDSHERNRMESVLDICEELRSGGYAPLAHRIESAEKLEHGNSAAMREALIIAKKAICHHAEWVCQSLSWENSNIQSNCADILCAHRDLCEAKTAINAALSEPSRNCDVKYADRVEMYGAFKDWCKAKGHTMEPMLAYDAFDWLLAPAEKQKGEGDGK